MGNDLTKGGRNAVASIENLKGNLAKVRGRVQSTGGDALLRFLTDGNWVFGKSDVEVKKDSDELAINPNAFAEGYVCWTNYDEKGKKNELLGEHLAPIGADPVSPVDLPDHGWPWKQQLAMELKFMGGPNKGKQVKYKTNSVGGLNMMTSILDAVMVQLDEDPDNPVPVIVLKSDHYQHTSYGRTYTPDYEIVDWVSMDGMPSEATSEDEEPSKPARGPRVQPEPEEDVTEAEEAEVVEEKPAPARRRRR